MPKYYASALGRKKKSTDKVTVVTAKVDVPARVKDVSGYITDYFKQEHEKVSAVQYWPDATGPTTCKV